MPLLRVFQNCPAKASLIPPLFLRKRRSLRRPCRYGGAWQAIAAEQEALREKKKIEASKEATHANSLKEVAIQKRKRAQYLG
ncbi:hypothetical protein JHK84_028973 [Glycine max]|nr:hypothetical protein JHK87_028636 [Glycine soja]KAG4997949.1 hypothetical protein JHK85_029388 [Glycine max]KAG5004707.1 hypothetical protein JHK86_028846 [Glycine max]KAG5152501.1 hypothetical protein JHK84_028973 [Glycine max]